METRASRPVFAGVALGLLTFAVYIIGSNRSFGYDAAATFANFVATPSLWDAFAVRTVIPTIPVVQVATNDHVLVSLISHAIFSVSGSRSEVVYRFIPALAAGATVGLSTAVMSKRFGLLAGVSAGFYIATDPMFADNSRDLRGYSLAALLAVIATLMLNPLPTRGEGRVGRTVYALVMGLAIAAQLFAGVVLLCHVAYVLTRKSRSAFVAMLPAWIVAALIGLAGYVPIYYGQLSQHGMPASQFYVTFPRDVVLFLVGAPFPLTMGLWLAAALLGLWTVRSAAWAWAAIAVVAVVVMIFWLALEPAYLYPRFFVFLVPGVAHLMASAIQRWRVVAPVVLLGAAYVGYGQVPTWIEDPLALPQAGAAVERLHGEGKRVCVIHSDEQILTAYTSDFTVVTEAGQLGQCDAVVVVSWGVELDLRDEAAREFPHLTTLEAFYPAVVLMR